MQRNYGERGDGNRPRGRGGDNESRSQTRGAQSEGQWDEGRSSRETGGYDTDRNYGNFGSSGYEEPRYQSQGSNWNEPHRYGGPQGNQGQYGYGGMQSQGGQYGDGYGTQSPGSQYGQGYGMPPQAGQYGQSYGQNYGQNYGQSQGQHYAGQYGPYGHGGGSHLGQYGPQQPYAQQPFGSAQQPGAYGGAGSQYGMSGSYGGAQYAPQGSSQQGRLRAQSGRGMSPGENYRGIGPKGYTRSDDRIKEEVCECLTDDASIDASNISIEVKDGIVTLTGSVDDRNMKHRAEDLAEDISGVKDVENRLSVQASARTSSTAPGQPTRATTRATGEAYKNH
jgi:osmotically-inducible protein OsmY